MSDIDIQIKRLADMIAQEKEILSVISDTHNHEEVREHIKQFEIDLEKLKQWKAKQETVRARNQTAIDSGAPCGGA